MFVSHVAQQLPMHLVSILTNLATGHRNRNVCSPGHGLCLLDSLANSLANILTNILAYGASLSGICRRVASIHTKGYICHNQTVLVYIQHMYTAKLIPLHISLTRHLNDGCEPTQFSLERLPERLAMELTDRLIYS